MGPTDRFHSRRSEPCECCRIEQSRNITDSLFSSNSQGVALAVASLVLTLAQDNLEAYAVCYQKAVSRLSKVSEIRPFRRESQTELRCFAGRPQKRIFERLRLLQSSSTMATSQASSFIAVLSSLR